jgi:hypothetical protein
MASTVAPRRASGSRAPYLLYAGVALFVALAFITGRSVWRAFNDRSGQARAAAVFDLVATRTPLRPTDAPGAMAWLRRAIDRLVTDSSDASLAEPGASVPAPLVAAAAALRGSSASESMPVTIEAILAAPPSTMRVQQLVRVGDRVMAVTRRRSIVEDHAISGAARTLVAADARLRETLSTLPLQTALGRQRVRPVRIYAVDEDATLVSLPWVDTPNIADSRRAAETEAGLISARPTVPAFAPADFFFRSEADGYSGFYLDLGGRGLVSTITIPEVSRDGTHLVVALDLAFDVDWHRLAASLEPPIIGVAVDVPDGNGSWNELITALSAQAPGTFRQALSEFPVAGQTPAGTNTEPTRHAVLKSGAVAAFHVADRTWLVAWFPNSPPPFPVAAMALLGVMLAVLLSGFEINRRRAERERRSAERALSEKQNLLNTMQVPLVVVDPNSDAIVSANHAADAIGFSAGRRFADLVWPDARARAYYERMQVATPEPRRAYGIPVAVTGAAEPRYAIVRSVAVTAPIEALNADERHRLGILIVIDEDADLALFSEDLSLAAHRDERRRLAGLLTHGVDTLARVLEHTLARRGADEFALWLAEYLERRISVTAWLLDHWDASLPLPRPHVIDSDQARATIARLRDVLAHVAADRELRSRLHWDNGTLSSPQPATLDVHLDWPDDADVTCPVRGGFGLFLNELVANATRHGTPGSTPRLSISCDRVRGELVCLLENAAPPDAASFDRADAYGGMSMVRAMARLFEWQDLAWRQDGDRVGVTWAMPFGTRRRGEAD